MTDEELIARLRKADEYEPLGHDGWEAADRIEALVRVRREDALELLAAHGQAQDAYEAQLKAEARADRLEAALRELVTCVEDGCFCSEMKMATAIGEARAAITEETHE